MGKLSRKYMGEYWNAIVSAKAVRKHNIVKAKIWIASKWLSEHQLEPWTPEYMTAIEALFTEDRQMYRIVIDGVLFMDKDCAFIMELHAREAEERRKERWHLLKRCIAFIAIVSAIISFIISVIILF